MVSVHPEGKRYAHNVMTDGLSVITEAMSQILLLQSNWTPASQ